MKTALKSLLFLLLFVPTIVLAQTAVSGTVTEQATGLPLPGVNILIKGTTTGTATDFDGNYTISASNGDIIVFSYVGFVTQEVTYNGQTTLNVQLVEDAAQLDEVVLIGYGATTKQDATGAVEKVGGEEFNRGAIVAPQQLIAGKAAGAVKGAASSAAGAVKQGAKDIGNKVTANKLMKAWKSMGEPLDSGSIFNILSCYDAFWSCIFTILFNYAIVLQRYSLFNRT